MPQVRGELVEGLEDEASLVQPRVGEDQPPSLAPLVVDPMEFPVEELPAQGVNVAHKFAADDLMYGVVGPPMSHIAQATLKIYGSADLATITTAASKPNLTEQGYNHFFRVNARNDAHVEEHEADIENEALRFAGALHGPRHGDIHE